MHEAAEFLRSNDSMNWTQAIAIEDARRAGFDLELMDALLALTPEERVIRHDAALEEVLKREHATRERRMMAAASRKRW